MASARNSLWRTDIPWWRHRRQERKLYSSLTFATSLFGGRKLRLRPGNQAFETPPLHFHRWFWGKKIPLTVQYLFHRDRIRSGVLLRWLPYTKTTSCSASAGDSVKNDLPVLPWSLSPGKATTTSFFRHNSWKKKISLERLWTLRVAVAGAGYRKPGWLLQVMFLCYMPTSQKEKIRSRHVFNHSTFQWTQL